MLLFPCANGRATAMLLIVYTTTTATMQGHVTIIGALYACSLL